MSTLAEPRVMVIEGQRVLAVERHPELPPNLSILLNGGFDSRGHLWPRIMIGYLWPIRFTGARTQCLSEQDHRLTRWMFGSYLHSTGLLDVLLSACLDCEAVRVMDVSFDRDIHYDPAGFRHKPRIPWRRRDKTLGWYSGARRNDREYR